MYDVNTITAKGAELLAAATAADKLILDGCDATTTFVDAATAALVESRPASALSNTTTVSIIGATTNHVTARASFIAGTNTGGDANTLYLYGHKQSAPSDIYVIYVASSQEPFHLPETGDVANVYETLFNMVYAANPDAVTTPGVSTYCTLAEFNLLKNRTVTTHEEGDDTVGEKQTILGDKTFNGSTLLNGETHAYSEFYSSNGIFVFPAIRVTAYDSNIQKITRITNIKNNTDLGLGLLESKNLVDTIDNFVDTGNSYYIRYGEYNVTKDNIQTLVAQITAAGFTCNAMTGSDIGSSALPFNHVYASELSISGDFSMGGDFTSNSVTTGGVTCSGDGHFADIYSQGGISCDNIEPYTDQGVGVPVGSVGSSNYPYNTVYVGGMVVTDTRIYCPIEGSVNYAGSISFTHNTAVNQTSVYGGNARLLLNTGVSDNQSLINLTVDGQKGLQITYNTQISDYQLSVTTSRMNVTSDFVTFSASTSVTISGNATINSLSVNELTGTQPTYSGSTTTVKVGSIVMAWVRPNLVSGNYFRAGETYHSSGTTSDTSTTLEIAESANNTFKRSTYSRILPNGVYAFLSDVDNSVATCSLVQCLSLD